MVGRVGAWAPAEEETMGMAETLRRLVGAELARRSEPGVRKFFDPGTGAPYDDVVAALAQVGVGLERDEPGSPLGDDALREQLAAWLADTAVVNPNLPKNSHRPQFQTGVRVQFEARGAKEPGARALDALAELALGAHEDAHPRAAAIAAPDLIVGIYLRGAETAVMAVESVKLSSPVRAARPRRTPAKRTRTAKRAKPAAARARGKARTKAKKKPASRPRRAAKPAAAKKRTGKLAMRSRARAVARAKARRKKK
jgi:hypothetical protein